MRRATRAGVLPNSISVIDDPTLTVFDGKTLIGSYDIDDEGVRAEKVSVIENGELVNYLVGREPSSWTRELCATIWSQSATTRW